MSIAIRANEVFSQGTDYSTTEVQKGKNNIFAGNLNIEQDPIAEKKKEAQKMAFGVVKNAWDNDRAVDKVIAERTGHYAELLEQKKEVNKSLSDVGVQQTELQKLYSVSDDSTEQQDLELLKKQQDRLSGVSHEPLSNEELAQLNEINKKPLTEYQSRSLELNKRAGTMKLQLEDIDKQMQDDIGDVKSILLEKLKSHGIVDASKTAEEIMGAANEDIIGMAAQEATDHIDDKMEESEKKAEETADEKKEKEQNLEQIKENRAAQEAIIEGTKEAVEKAKKEQQKNDAPDMELGEILDITMHKNPVEDVQQSLDEIKSSMKLLEADLKGIKVDEEV